jgi:hypothetical protein
MSPMGLPNSRPEIIFSDFISNPCAIFVTGRYRFGGRSVKLVMFSMVNKMVSKLLLL